MNSSSQAILLIDDRQDKLQNLARRVSERVEAAEVRMWCPRDSEDLSAAFANEAQEGTVLVVTDYDLTTAVRGLFGHTVVAWCRNRFIPVGDFSRGHGKALSTEPELFKLRVPRSETDAVSYIARMFEGFRQIREGLERESNLLTEGTSPAQILAVLLGRKEMESQIGPYFSRPGLFNSSLLDTLKGGDQGNASATEEEKTNLLTYILGHVLVNAVLKYPGPILAQGPLCAYLATSSEDIERVANLFEGARYRGPFDSGERLFWRDDVDDAIEKFSSDHGIDDTQYDSFGEYHRAVVEKALGGSLAKHRCDRCDGVKGGFWCPLTKRPVCERSDCSSPASSWVPSGAYVCRVERDHFEEKAPLLGL